MDNKEFGKKLEIRTKKFAISIITLVTLVTLNFRHLINKRIKET